MIFKVKIERSGLNYTVNSTPQSFDFHFESTLQFQKRNRDKGAGEAAPKEEGEDGEEEFETKPGTAGISHGARRQSAGAATTYPHTILPDNHRTITGQSTGQSPDNPVDNSISLRKRTSTRV